MKKIYLISSKYEPNTAPTNRFLAFVEGFSRLGICVDAVFILSNKNNSRVEKYWPNVNIHYLWDRINCKNRYFRQLIYSILSWLFVRKVKAGDTVLIFESERIMFPLIRKKGVRVFSEKTEHPNAFKVRTIDMEKYVYECRNLDGLFVISTALKKYFVNHGVPDNKVSVINMIVDPKRFEGIKKQKQENPYIAYCGTASNNKDGVDELIKSFALVVKKYPQYRLYIIGKGLTKDDDSGNRELVETLKLQDKVVFTGVVTSEEMPQLLKNADILALDRPNNLQAKHGFPTKLGEYLLTENPVVVTSVGDIPLFLKDGESALIAEPNNPESFASKIIWAIEHSKEAEQIGKNGCQVAVKEFNAIGESKKMVQAMGFNI